MVVDYSQKGAKVLPKEGNADDFLVVREAQIVAALPSDGSLKSLEEDAFGLLAGVVSGLVVQYLPMEAEEDLFVLRVQASAATLDSDSDRDSNPGPGPPCSPWPRPASTLPLC